ncbi:MAG TPA: cyanophycinase [Mycobacteriales bacterium]|jgi:cyanophycinase|nr:cyanophycinase [Mycobacteriales bacterium]
MDQPDVDAPRGVLMVIGGAEDKLGHRTILGRFARLAGGSAASIAVISTASALGDTATEVYRAVFERLGVADVRGLRPQTRAEADDPACAAVLDEVTGVFMTGGNQNKLSSVVAGTRLGDAIKAAYAAGAVVGGTSAGASVVTSHMVATGAEGATPKERMVQLAAGLGLIDGVIFDQHFAQRNRYGRLLALVAHSPALLGVGVDEDTAMVVTEGRYVEVLGRGAITVFDGGRLVTSAHAAKGTQPLLVSNVVLHSLPAGARFDLATRALQPERRRAEDPDIASGMRLNRLLARRIAAEGADDTVVARNARRRQKAAHPERVERRRGGDT